MNDVRRFLIVNMCQCENCQKMFYLCRTRMYTFTIKLDDIDPEELAQFSISENSSRHYGRKRKSRSSTSHNISHSKRNSSSRENEKKS